jgi:hypothetical protein
MPRRHQRDHRRQPGSTFDLVRIATDVDERTARLISEAGLDLPGVEVASRLDVSTPTGR